MDSNNIANKRAMQQTLCDKSIELSEKNEKLKNIILLGYGGSIAYGTNNENSDVDIRGIALNSRDEILTGCGFEQVVENETDTTIYSFNKIIKLLMNCNPNVIEILGLRPEHYIYTDAGYTLLKNKQLFLSKQCMYSFGGYANAQLRRLQHKTMENIPQEEQEEHIRKSIEHARVTFGEYADNLKLFIDKSKNEDMDSEIFLDWDIKHVPLRDFRNIMNDMSTIIRSYEKIGKRNENAMTHEKLGKHMMHLVRLYLMCIDILEKGEIVTYREKEHDFLMDIRNGKFLKNGLPVEEFFNIVEKLENKMEKAYEMSKLPDKPNVKKIKELQISINETIL